MRANTSDNHASKGRQLILLILLVSLVLIAKNNHAVASGDLPRYHEHGSLTDIEDNDNVIIDKRGYFLDPSVLVVDTTGRPISLDKLPIPTEVIFEYSYKEGTPKTMSPVIVFIQETQKKEHNGRSVQ